MRLIKYDNLWNDSLSDFDTMLERVFGGRFESPFFLGESQARGFRVDTYADADAYHVVAEVPGIPKDAIDLKLENAVLTISGEHKQGEGENERRYSFSRSITVGDDVDAEKVSAKLENGLLTIDLPKLEERKPRAITIG